MLRDGVHVDAGARGADVHRRADALGARRAPRESSASSAASPGVVPLCTSAEKPPRKLTPDLGRRAVEVLGEQHVVVARRTLSATSAIGVTEMRLLMIGMPYSRSISSPTATSRAAERQILS